MKRVYLILIIFYSCSSNSDQELTYFIDSDQKVNYGFDDAFTLVDSISLKFSDEERVIPRMRSLLVNQKKEIFIGDYSKGTIARFSENGEFLGDIGSRGRGPGEFDFMGNGFIDSENNLWVFDAGLLRMTKFDYPEYNYNKAFTIENRLGNFAITGSEIIALSRKYDHIFQYSEDGDLNKQENLEIFDQDLKTFLTRFNGGGLALSENDHSVYIITPEKFEIRQYSKDLELIKTITSGESISDYRPDPPEFPKNLDPFDITNKHKKWFGSFLHIGRIFVIQNEIIMVAVYRESLTENDSTEIFLNLYTSLGEVLVEGLKLPKNAFPVAVQGQILYLTNDEELLEDGELRPTIFRKYRFDLPK